MGLNPQTILTLISFVSALILIGLAIQGYLRRHITGSRAFIAMMISVAIWSFFYAFEVMASSQEMMLLAQRFKYFGVTTVPVAWLVFAGQFSSRMKNIRPYHLGLLLIVPTCSILLLWSSEFHNLFFVGQVTVEQTAGMNVLAPNYGVWWAINLVYSYALILVGAYWLISASVESIDLYQSQSQIILIGVAVPVIGNILTLTNITPLRGIDLAPIFFTISAVIFERYLLQARSLGTTPLSYHAIIDNLPEAVMVIDSNFVILSVNPPLLRLLRQKENQIIGADVNNFAPEIAEFINNQPGWISTSHEIVLSGRYIELNISTLEDENDVQGYVLTFRDVTIRKQTESALYSNERRYRTLFEKSNDAIFILELSGTLIFANTEAAHLLDTDLGRLVQHGLIHYIPESEQENFNAQIKKLVDGEPIPIYETVFVRFTGQEVPAEVSLTLVLSSDGDPSQVQMIVRDISERKQAEKMREQQIDQYEILRSVDEKVNSTLDIRNVLEVSLSAAMDLSHADAGFIAISKEDAVVVEEVKGLYNTRILGQKLRYDEGISGYVMENHEAVLARNVHDFENYKVDIPETKSLMSFPLISQDRLIGVLSLEATESGIFNQSIFNFMKLLVSRIAVALENARLYEYVSTQLTKTEGMNEELRQAELLKTDMIRIANHDIKNPLSIAQGYVSVMQLDIDLLPPDYDEYLMAMWKSLARIESILDDFMSVEAMNQRASGAIMRVLDMRDIITEAIEEYEPQILSKLQGLTIDLCESGNAMVNGDRSQLYEAVANLLGNASKYTQDGGSIAVHLEVANAEVIYRVVDNGYGIPDDRKKRMFEPFYRAKVPEAADIDGNGLGLHLVKNIIKRHDGEMIFESVYKKGSTFGFRLPLVEDGTRPLPSFELDNGDVT